jgi:hypothetical protein
MYGLAQLFSEVKRRSLASARIRRAVKCPTPGRHAKGGTGFTIVSEFSNRPRVMPDFLLDARDVEVHWDGVWIWLYRPSQFWGRFLAKVGSDTTIADLSLPVEIWRWSAACSRAH